MKEVLGKSTGAGASCFCRQSSQLRPFRKEDALMVPTLCPSLGILPHQELCGLWRGSACLRVLLILSSSAHFLSIPRTHL